MAPGIARDSVQQGQINPSRGARVCQGGGWGTLTPWELMAFPGFPQGPCPCAGALLLQQLGQCQWVWLHPNTCKGFLSKEIFITLHYQALPFARTEGVFAKSQ